MRSVINTLTVSSQIGKIKELTNSLGKEINTARA
jgi:hypothetical protein